MNLLLPAMLRNPRTNPKVLKNLKEIQKNFNEKEDKKKDEQVKQEEKSAHEKEFLRKQLMKRSLEQGVSNMNQKDMDHALLFNFGSREKLHKREGHDHDIQFINLEDEETREREMIQILMRKYAKALKNIFVKYSNSGSQRGGGWREDWRFY